LSVNSLSVKSEQFDRGPFPLLEIGKETRIRRGDSGKKIHEVQSTHLQVFLPCFFALELKALDEGMPAL
jgi:hypothetical protein